MNSEHDRLELIRRHFDGAVSEEERNTLQEVLRHDAAFRRLFARYANIDSALGSGMIALKQPERSLERTVRFQWRPLWAAAAGLVIGLASASLVYGFVTQRHPKPQTLLAEGFENVEMLRDHGFPQRVGVWSGDFLAPQGSEGDVKPAEGLRMVTLQPVEKRKFSYATRFLDLTAIPSMGALLPGQIEVTARFHGASPNVQDRFQIRLAAFAEDIAGARAIWFGGDLDGQALVHVAKTVTMAPGTQGWSMLRSTIHVPAGARLLLISLAASVADDGEPKTPHYLDDVQVRLIAPEALP